MRKLVRTLLVFAWLMAGFLALFGVAAIFRGQWSPFFAMVITVIVPLSVVTYKLWEWLGMGRTDDF